MNISTSRSDSALPSMIDTHCHLDDHQFDNDLEEVIAASRAANVNRWVLIGYDPVRWDEVIEISCQTDGMSHTLGVHPACAQHWNDDASLRLRGLIIASKAVAIGETGLDFYRDNAPFSIQVAAFRGQLELAIDLDLPVVIHMRDAESEMLQLLEAIPVLPVLIFHSFDGSEHLMRFILENESYVGIGGLATRQKSDMLRTLLKQVPLERLLLETDSPYLVPARQKDRRNQPANIPIVATIIAKSLNISPAVLATHTTLNAERVFGLDYGQ